MDKYCFNKVYKRIFSKSIPFFKSWSKVNFNSWSLESWLFCNWVWIICIDYIIWEIHHNNLRIASLTSWGNLFINHFRCNFTIIRFKMTSKASFIIMISFPYHTLHSWMISIIMPVAIIIYVELSLSIFYKSISIVNTWTNSKIYWTCTIGV